METSHSNEANQNNGPISNIEAFGCINDYKGAVVHSARETPQ
jgi:hypothetical protein